MIQQNNITLAAERSRLHTFLLCCGIIGAALFSIVNFTFGALSPNYDIARQSVGDLELTSYGWVQSANFIFTGLFMCAFALGLKKELVAGQGSIALPMLQYILGFVMISLGVFIHNPAHAWLTFALFVVIMSSFFLFVQRFSHDARWKSWSFYTGASAILMAALFVLYVWSRMNHWAYTGLLERAVLLLRVIWTLFFTVRLLAGARLDPMKTR